jgi:hypothetical protein
VKGQFVGYSTEYDCTPQGALLQRNADRHHRLQGNTSTRRRGASQDEALAAKPTIVRCHRGHGDLPLQQGRVGVLNPTVSRRPRSNRRVHAAGVSILPRRRFHLCAAPALTLTARRKADSYEDRNRRIPQDRQDDRVSMP